MKKLLLLSIVILGGIFITGCEKEEKATDEQIAQQWENVEFFYDQRVKQVDVMLRYMDKEDIARDAVYEPLKKRMDSARNATDEEFEAAQAEFSRVLKNGFQIVFSIPEYQKNETLMGFATLIGKTEVKIYEMVEVYNGMSDEPFEAVLGANPQ